MNLPALPITTNTGDTSSSAASLSNQGELPKDFVELLGKHLSLSSVSSSDKPVVGTDADKEALLNALGKDISALDGDALNTILASFNSLSGVLAQSGKQISEDTAQSSKAEKSDTTEDKNVTDAAVAMQALFAMLPVASGTTAVVDDNIADKIKNFGLNLSGFADKKEVTASSDVDIADDETRGALSQLLGASTTAAPNSTAGSQHIVKQTSAANQSVDDAAKLAVAVPVTSNEHSSQESMGTSGNSFQTSHIPVASNVQSTFTNGSATQAQPAGTQLSTPFGSPQWQDALGQQIIMFSRNGQQNAELRLNPQELGSLHISLKIDDNQAQIHLVSANSQVRSALEAALPHLRSAMAESGINLGQSSVGSDASAWQQTQQQMANNSNSSGSSSYQQQFGNASENAVEAIEVPAHLQSMASSVNGVDIFA